VIHQPVSVVSQCGAGAWLNRLASGDQRRLTGSDSASEACSRRCAIQIHRYLLTYLLSLPNYDIIIIININILVKRHRQSYRGV